MWSNCEKEETDVVLKLQEEFGNEKVIGRVKDLVIPIKTNCNMLFYQIASKYGHVILIDKEATSTLCVKFLREQQLGVETFLPLDRLDDESLCDSVRLLGDAYHMSIEYMRQGFTYNPKIETAVKWITNNFNESDEEDDDMFIHLSAIDTDLNASFNAKVNINSPSDFNAIFAEDDRLLNPSILPQLAIELPTSQIQATSPEDHVSSLMHYLEL